LHLEGLLLPHILIEEHICYMRYNRNKCDKCDKKQAELSRGVS